MSPQDFGAICKRAADLAQQDAGTGDVPTEAGLLQKTIALAFTYLARAAYDRQLEILTQASADTLRDNLDLTE